MDKYIILEMMTFIHQEVWHDLKKFGNIYLEKSVPGTTPCDICYKPGHSVGQNLGARTGTAANTISLKCHNSSTVVMSQSLCFYLV